MKEVGIGDMHIIITHTHTLTVCFWAMSAMVLLFCRANIAIFLICSFSVQTKVTYIVQEAVIVIKVHTQQHSLSLSDRKVFLATWKEIPPTNEVQTFVDNIFINPRRSCQRGLL